MSHRPHTVIVVMAHNEERRIATCLSSLPLGAGGVDVHVVVNGSSDATAAIARETCGTSATVHEWPQGGKARSWNRIVHDCGIAADTWVFVDGDAEVVPGSVSILADALANDSLANAASAPPRNGRRVAHYSAGIAAERGLFGDLYALSGDFVRRMQASGIRLPEDLVGDDALIGAMAKTDLGNEDNWRDDRVIVCPEAGFLCEPASLGSPRTLVGQYKRMINYSVRHFQNRIVSDIMRGAGPAGLPRRMSEHYPEWLHRFTERPDLTLWWFDRKALAKMRQATG